MARPGKAGDSAGGGAPAGGRPPPRRHRLLSVSTLVANLPCSTREEM
uniref:Predicted protein n=1 Tax=Hordeum vulgare subsp. vulgare TaxID=112509 RepID=F2E8G5_HORVV|nr:predicted protein [Hordeum vulgare subsp. vulgare]